MYIEHDADEWEAVVEHHPCSCGGIPGTSSCRRPGGCNGSTGYGMKRRDSTEVQRIKAERRQKEEDEILRQADVIRQRRGL